MSVRLVPPVLLAAAFAAGCTGCAKDKPGATAPVEHADPSGRAQVTHLTGATSTMSGRKGAACGPRGLPPDRHFVAEGLCARVIAHGQGELRGLTFAPNGDLVAVTSRGEVRRYRDIDHDGLYAAGAPETVVWARTDGDNGHNCAFDGLDLYCGSKAGVRRWRYTPEIDRGGPGDDVVVGMPEGGRHPTHPVGVWDGFLYVVSGSADNSMSPMPADFDTSRNVVKRFALAKLAAAKPWQWKDGEIVVRGVRNVTAMARDPRGHVIGIDNSFDDIAHGGADVHEDNPGEPIVAIEPGKKYGYPFCFYAQRIVENGVVIAPGTPLASEVKHDTPVFKEIAKDIKSSHDDAWCAANVDRPKSFVQAHSSALGMTFPSPSAPFALADKWRAGAFVALHGSWDREPSTGNKVIWIPFDRGGNAPMPTSTKDATVFAYETVFGGGKYGAPRDGEWSWKLGDAGEDPVRPVGVAISPLDGALYVSSDNTAGPTSAKNGSIYRIALLGK
jgi:glucose/arabinose dehydrogenase